ncbi:MAG: right-handed parallel beta-helix repeat-containing protein [Phycisphaerales bacterium]
MGLKLLTLTACLIIGSACAQDVSLQKLIDDANDSSSIPIPSGGYVLSEPLHINKNITLVGSPFAYIDARGASQILQADNPKANVTIVNILFMNGSGDYGGAIASQAKSLTIKGCSFLDNLAYYGAAIYQMGGNLQVIESTFEGNNATIWGAAIQDEAGDVLVESSKFTQNTGSRVIYVNGTHPKQARVSVRDCDISENPGPYSDLSSGFSGAIVCENSTALVDHCNIKGNKALVMTPTLLGGVNAGLSFGYSDVTLNDTLIEGNEALYVPALSIGGNSRVMINRCTIAGNRALSVLYKGDQVDGDVAGISISVGSEVIMDDVSISNNQVGGECAAISNSGTLSLKNVRIYGNTAGNISSIRNSKHGRLIFGKDVQIYGNEAPQDVYSEGPVKMDFD